MAQNHKTIVKALLEATTRASNLSGENTQLVQDLRKISKKLVKSHFKTSIFNKYEDQAIALGIVPVEGAAVGGNPFLDDSELDEEVDNLIADLEAPKRYSEKALDPKSPSKTMTRVTLTPNES